MPETVKAALTGRKPSAQVNVNKLKEIWGAGVNGLTER
jgi:hypothetical protein